MTTLPPGSQLQTPGDLPASPARRTVLRGSATATALALLGSSALLAACGGGDDDNDTGTGTGPSAPGATVPAPTLVGRAILPADSYVAGPTSGQFVSGGDLDRATATYGYRLPFVGKQPMQGFSAVIPGPIAGTFYAMQDNGFGGKASSPDALLHIYAIGFDWTRGAVIPVDFTTGAPLTEFGTRSFIRLSDPNRFLGYRAVADAPNYPGRSVSPAGQTLPVDPSIITNRLLTGGDIDPESLQRDAEGNFWIGDEFGPFLLKFDRQGRLLAREVQLPNLRAVGANPLVQTSNNPYLAGNAAAANLPGSGGLESMAINTSRTRLYAMFEAAITNDDARRRVINVYNLATQNFDARSYSYRVGVSQRVNGSGNLETEIHTVNDMVAISDTAFLVMEKDSGAGDVRAGFPASGTSRNAARVKRIYQVSLDKIDSNGDLIKEEVVDLMNLRDPDGIGKTATLAGIYTHPMESMEVVCIVGASTLLVVNDNNYPGGSPSRSKTKPDDNEFVLIRLPKALPV